MGGQAWRLVESGAAEWLDPKRVPKDPRLDIPGPPQEQFRNVFGAGQAAE